MQTRFRGFTLIELMVVISIILILAGLSIPSIRLVQEAGQKAQASSMANAIKTALTSYNTEYGTWPYDNGTGGGTGPSSTTLSPTNAYKMFIGDPNQELKGTTYSNPKEIVFMNFQARDLDNPEQPTKFVTPWRIHGAPTDYHMEVDGNYTNQLDGIPDCNNPGGSGTMTLNAGCAVWCTGIPVNGAENTNTLKFIRTW